MWWFWSFKWSLLLIWWPYTPVKDHQTSIWCGSTGTQFAILQDSVLLGQNASSALLYQAVVTGTELLWCCGCGEEMGSLVLYPKMFPLQVQVSAVVSVASVWAVHLPRVGYLLLAVVARSSLNVHFGSHRVIPITCSKHHVRGNWQVKNSWQPSQAAVCHERHPSRRTKQYDTENLSVSGSRRWLCAEMTCWQLAN